MVLYFTGTGNSRYIARRVAEALDDELFCINDRLRAGDTAPVFSHKSLVIVTPTYAWRIPLVVRDWLRKTQLPHGEKTWFIMNCGSEIGNAQKYNSDLCREKGLTYMGTAQIVMPENYIAMFNAPSAEQARNILEKAQPDIDRAIEAIRTGRQFEPTRRNLYDRVMSGPVNPLFYRFAVKATPFTVSDACISCGKCASLCPLNNISLRDGKPVWGDRCTHCMACICHCPAEAIEYGKKSQGKPRYHIESL